MKEIVRYQEDCMFAIFVDIKQMCLKSSLTRLVRRSERCSRRCYEHGFLIR